jgi:hypothetical protein
MVGHHDVTKQLKFLLIVVKVEAIEQGDDETGSGENRQTIVDDRRNIVDVPFDVKSG